MQSAANFCTWLWATIALTLGSYLAADPIAAISAIDTDFLDLNTNPVLYQDNLAFFTSQPNTYVANGLTFYNDAEGLREVVNISTPHPSDTRYNLSGLYLLDADDDYVYFVANSNFVFSGRYGIFRTDGLSVESVVEDADSLFESTGFAAIAGLRVGAGKVVFRAQQGTEMAYFVWDAGISTRIAALNQTVEENDGSLLELPTSGVSISRNGQHLVIRVKTGLADGVGQPDKYTIYRFVDDSLQAVAKSGDNLGDGITLYNLNQQPVVLNDGTILFGAQVLPSTANPAFIRVSPDKQLALYETAPTSGGFNRDFSFGTGANNGISVYGTLTTRDGFAFLSDGLARTLPDGDAELILENPFPLDGREWTANGFSIHDANTNGFVARAEASDGSATLISNLPYLTNQGSAETVSIWNDYPSISNFKYSSSLQWILDGQYPLVYSANLQRWFYISPQGADLESFYFLDIAGSAWYWSAESLNGWAFRFQAPGKDPEWVLFPDL